MRRGWPLALLVLAECSPMVGFEIKFELADGSAITASRLHLRGRRLCSLGEQKTDTPPEPPPPGREEIGGDTERVRIDFQRDPSDPRHASARFRGSRCEVALTAWYDGNNDGVVNAGDFTATYPRSTISTHNGCGDAANHFGTLVLKPVP